MMIIEEKLSFLQKVDVGALAKNTITILVMPPSKFSLQTFISHSVNLEYYKTSILSEC